MNKAVSAAEANRKFSHVLRNVKAGHSYVVTSHGRPVAKIIPFGTVDRAAARGRETLLDRLGAESVVDVGRWTRDELYEDRP